MSRRKTVDKDNESVELRYSNWFSQLVNLIQPTNIYIIGGRGTSKSTDILAERSMDIAYEMPGAFVAFSSDSYMNAIKNIVPSIIEGWKRKGWIEDIHFVVDARPPKHFKLPYKPVLNWKHTVTAFTGTHFKIISQDRPSIGAGDSFQHHMGDEAKYLKEEKLNKVTPAVRGEYVRFGKSPFYGGDTFTTDMPNPNQGEHDWIMRMADNMDKEKIRTLVQLAIEVNKERIRYINTQKKYNDNPADTTAKRKFKNAEKSMKRWEERLRLFRKDTTFFYIVSSFVNADILTEGYFKKLLETMDFREFMVSILSIPPKLDQGVMFYPNFSYKNVFNDGYIYDRRDNFKINDEYIESSLDLKYILHDLPLDGGLDTGNMCSLVIGQEHGKQYRGLKEFWTLPPDFLPELGKNFVEYFKYHKRKELRLYHDRAANKWKQVGEDHASKIKKAIEYDENGRRTGWNVILMNQNQGNILQETEYELMLEMMSGKNDRLPILVIDKHNCKCWKSSMEQAMKIIRVDREGKKTIHKDKSSEKLPVHQLPMKSTNMSDAGKYLLCRPEYLNKLKGHSILMTSNPSLH
ncbi:hypothetical protein [Abyssalbus ytuae]|uniref:Uncharacterized protein n=1 Tax=Abyssalbus ytuae TaxID=2926907 RepID=A0A9E6ZLQ5_9FLAO|nr:hypothetical protein [Abyssalbus ytuae]UOB16580.1 hypothetical protein MQE35_12645 [Abyssalbus ytuae]